MTEANRPKLLNYNLDEAHLYPWDFYKFKTTIYTNPNYAYNTSTYTEKGRVIREFGAAFEKYVPEKGLMVEIGTSIGYTTQELSSLRPEMNIYGTDINPKVIKHLLDNNEVLSSGKLELAVIDGFDMPFAPNSIDVLVWMNSLVQVLPSTPDIKLKTIFQKIDRTIKSGGVFLLSGYIEALSYRVILIKNLDQSKYRILLPTNDGDFLECNFHYSEDLPDEFIEVNKDLKRFLDFFV